MIQEVVVKEMTSEIKRLNIISIKREHFANSLLFAPAFIIAKFKTRAELAKNAVFEEIKREFPDLNSKNCQLRKDYTIVFKDYTDKD